MKMKKLSDRGFKWHTVLLAFLLGFAVAPNVGEARTVARVDHETAYIELTDDPAAYCPPGTLLVTGRDIAGIPHEGCWTFKDEKREKVWINWSDEPTIIYEFDTELFAPVKPATKV